MVEENELIHHITFKEEKTNDSLYSNVSDGSFGLDVAPYKFETCRERFGRYWNENTLGFFLKHPADAGYSVATFLKKTELLLKETKFSEYSLTNNNTLLWIEPSQFWKCCRMRRSLLTIFVRAGMTYDPKKDNYEEVLFAEKFIKPTKTAVMRFLYGFTKYEGPSIEEQPTIESRGWKYIFESADVLSVKNWLKWPTKDQYEPKAQLSESTLWL